MHAISSPGIWRTNHPKKARLGSRDHFNFSAHNDIFGMAQVGKYCTPVDYIIP